MEGLFFVFKIENKRQVDFQIKTFIKLESDLGMITILNREIEMN